MQLSKTPFLIQMWVGKDLPIEHIIVKDKPNNINKLINIYFKRWLIHPIRRKIARYYLMFLRRFFGTIVIGITGSAGKTTTKEMVKAILSQKGDTVASIKNIDPIYNIPQSILRCGLKTKYLVLEMGVEFVGEMDFYIWLAKPDISLITNIFPTHTQFFGDKNGVFKEKIKIISYLDKESYAILNSQDKLLSNAKEHTKARILYFGGGTEISAENVVFGEKSTKYTLHLDKSNISVQLPLIGPHFVSNSLAAATVAKILNVPNNLVGIGLESFEKPPHRMNGFYTKKGAYVLDDSYNNNPEAAIETLKTFDRIARGRKKIVVFGDMLELGELEEKYHKNLGNILSSYKLNLLIGVGEASRVLTEEAKKKMDNDKCIWVKNNKGVYDIITKAIDKDTAILIKGSRALKLEAVVDRLKNI